MFAKAVLQVSFYTLQEGTKQGFSLFLLCCVLHKSQKKKINESLILLKPAGLFYLLKKMTYEEGETSADPMRA